MPAQKWVWHRNFLAIARFEDPIINFPQDTGLGSYHLAMLQMTPQGDATPNTATVSNCWFDGAYRKLLAACTEGSEPPVPLAA